MSPEARDDILFEFWFRYSATTILAKAEGGAVSTMPRQIVTRQNRATSCPGPSAAATKLVTTKGRS